MSDGKCPDIYECRLGVNRILRNNMKMSAERKALKAEIARLKAEVSKAWSRGYLCALATTARSHGYNTEHVEALGAGGFKTIQSMERVGADEFDIEALRPVLADLRAKEKRKFKVT